MKLAKLFLFFFCFCLAFCTKSVFGCVKTDGVRYVSRHYEGEDDLIKEGLLRIEALMRSKDFLRASVECEKLDSAAGDVRLSCGESLALTLRLIRIECLSEARRDDPELPKLAEKALVDFKKISEEKVSACYTDFFWMLMSYYWTLGDVRSHDLAARRLLSYDPSSKIALMTLIYAAVERPYSVTWLGEFLDGFSGEKDALYMIGDFLRSDISAEKKQEKIISWLNNNSVAGESEMQCFLTGAASVLDVKDPEFIRDYCRALRQWLLEQKDDKNRLPLIVLVMNEWRRVEALAML